MKWTFVTATFGDDKYYASGKRIVSQAQKLGVFSEYIHVTDLNLEEFAPSVKVKYEKFLNSQSVGYGFYAWKPEIISRLLHSRPNQGICYVDAGCEVNSNVISKLRFVLWLKRAEKMGYLLHDLNYAEYEYTKKEVLDYFKVSDDIRNSNQIQATWLLLCGDMGKKIVDRWLSAAISDIRWIDDKIREEQSEFFKEHRYDQSLLSLSVKSLGQKPNCRGSCYRPVSFKSGIRCALSPIWSSRNRSGLTIQKKTRNVLFGYK